MSLKIIEDAISRFLLNPSSEVLCISGGWGVGKTYAWKKFVRDATLSNRITPHRYSYVSLFGLNSLDDLRFAVVENTLTDKNLLKDPDLNTFSAMFAKGSDLARKLRPALDIALAVGNKNAVADVLRKASFLTVRDQLICFDDLERSGSGLTPRDVLGLVSYLKESRNCKVVLLLNEEKLSDGGRQEFNRQLEKVADISLKFELSSDEACSIALTAKDEIGELIAERVSKLGITNIRVIRKIERLARKLVADLEKFDQPVVEQAINALVIGCMAVYQPDTTPPLGDLLRFNSVLDGMERLGEESVANPWGEVLKDYPFEHADEFDIVIINGAAGGYFDTERLREAAARVQSEIRRTGNESELSRAWRELYHGSLATEDKHFLDALYDGAVATISDVSFTNINSAIYMLREFEGDDRADDLVRRYMAAHDDEGLDFFDIDRHMFDPSDRADEALQAAFRDKAKSYVDPRAPLDVLKAVGQGGWNDDDILLMSKQTADDFERMFEAVDGIAWRKPIQTLLAMGRSSHAGANSIGAAATEALRRIAQKSPIRERKIRALGLSFDPQDGEGGPARL